MCTQLDGRVTGGPQHGIGPTHRDRATPYRYPQFREQVAQGWSTQAYGRRRTLETPLHCRRHTTVLPWDTNLMGCVG